MFSIKAIKYKTMILYDNYTYDLLLLFDLLILLIHTLKTYVKILCIAQPYFVLYYHYVQIVTPH